MSRTDLGYWDVRVGRFVVEAGDYTVAVAASSRDIRAEAQHPVVGDEVRVPLTSTSLVAEVLEHPVAGPALLSVLQSAMAARGGNAEKQPSNIVKMLASMPVSTMMTMLGDPQQAGLIEAVLDEANNAR